MAAANFKFDIGERVEDRVTKFSGIVVNRTEWQYGCLRYGIQPEKMDKEGKPKEFVVFDEGALVSLKPADEPKPKRTGGPRDDRRALSRR